MFWDMTRFINQSLVSLCQNQAVILFGNILILKSFILRGHVLPLLKPLLQLSLYPVGYLLLRKSKFWNLCFQLFF